MIIDNYNIGKNVDCMTKHNINYNKTLLLNITCSNYITQLIEEGVKYDLLQDKIDRLLSLINKLLK